MKVLRTKSELEAEVQRLRDALEDIASASSPAAIDALRAEREPLPYARALGRVSGMAAIALRRWPA